jgi:predicted HAD superfamily phosphohydrolase
MTANETGEKIYYSDSTSKVTNIRVTCNHITVPVDKIESVDVNFRIEAFSFSTLIFLTSFFPFLFIDKVPEAFDTAFLFFETLIIIASALWLFLVYKDYIELIVTVGGRSLVIHSANMRKKDYICKIAAAIGDAISDEEKFKAMQKTGEVKPSAVFNPSETMRLKLMLEDYEKLTAKK